MDKATPEQIQLARWVADSATELNKHYKEGNSFNYEMAQALINAALKIQTIMVKHSYVVEDIAA